MDFSKQLFRASGMGQIMSGTAKGWDVENSLTCKRFLVDLFREKRYNRFKDVSNKYTTKGNECEELSIDLYCSVKNRLFTKNTIRLNNLWFTGEVDLYEGETIETATHTIDTKTSYSLSTFPSILDKPDSDYIYQGQTYMALTGAKKHTVAYCLVNNTYSAILDEKRRLGWKLGVIDEETEEYVKACKDIEKNNIFDMQLFKKHYPTAELHHQGDDWQFDIPEKERLIEFTFDRDEATISAMMKRVEECRLWLNNYAATFN